jgi:radical SAM superfamily enzyme YgiQ (UPF0313 family)
LDIKWRCILYPKNIDEELIALMARSGCKEVAVGSESGSEPVLRWLNKRFKLSDVVRICGMLADYGIRRMGFLLLGGPGETRETVLESLKFADSLNLDMVKISTGIRIYPYTLLADVAVKEGIIGADDDLLFPKFYMVPGLRDWLLETTADWIATRPNWIY